MLLSVMRYLGLYFRRLLEKIYFVTFGITAAQHYILALKL